MNVLEKIVKSPKTILAAAIVTTIAGFYGYLQTQKIDVNIPLQQAQFHTNGNRGYALYSRENNLVRFSGGIDEEDITYKTIENADSAYVNITLDINDFVDEVTVYKTKDQDITIVNGLGNGGMRQSSIPYERTTN